MAWLLLITRIKIVKMMTERRVDVCFLLKLFFPIKRFHSIQFPLHCTVFHTSITQTYLKINQIFNDSKKKRIKTNFLKNNEIHNNTREIEREYILAYRSLHARPNCLLVPDKFLFYCFPKETRSTLNKQGSQKMIAILHCRILG